MTSDQWLTLPSLHLTLKSKVITMEGGACKNLKLQPKTNLHNS
ncbi:hypothetical protein [Scytonema sp. NUACC26]